MSPPRRRRLSREPAIERITWILFGGIAILAALAAVLPSISSDPLGSEPAPNSGSAGAPSETASTTLPDGGNNAPRRFTISASGDILIHERVADAARVGDSYDFTSLFANVKPLISTRDFAICHLEVPLSSTDSDLAFGGSADGGAFRAPSPLADAISDAGFRSCSVASNHSYDSGESSVTSTIEQLTRAGLPHPGVATSGEQAERLWQFTVKDTTVGHLSYTYGLNGREPGEVPDYSVAQIDEAKILADAARHRALGTEFTIVSLHWGDEFNTELTDQQADLGPTLLASPDIDLIIGHHAHVPQRIEEIDGKYIAYGLGNLLSNQSSSAPECPTACPVESQDGMLVDFVVDRRADGSLGVVDVVVNPTWVDVGGTWQIVDTQAPPVTGIDVDATILADSADRTFATVGVSP